MPAAVPFKKASVNMLKDMNLSSDTLGVFLTNTVPTATTDEVLGDITEITAGNGYSAGGPDVTITSLDDSDVAGVAELVLADVTITATGGAIAAFRYYGLYDKTTTTKYLLCYYDYGSELTLAEDQALDIDFDDGSGNGALRLGVGTIS